MDAPVWATDAVNERVGLPAVYRLDGSTVHDDGKSDSMQCGQGLDWFFAHLSGSKKEKISGLRNGEVLTVI